MAKYQIAMRFVYVVDTDDIERTLEEFEFPTFPDLDGDTQVEFVDNINDYGPLKEGYVMFA